MSSLTPSQLTLLAIQVGETLTKCHNAFRATYSEAYSSKSGKNGVIDAVLNEGKEKQRLVLADFANDLQHVAKILARNEKAFVKIWKAPNVKRICTHCDDRVALPHSTLCGFCHSWTKSHLGNLPSDSVLEIKQHNSARHSPKP